jgi:hypothetical protein
MRIPFYEQVGHYAKKVKRLKRVENAGTPNARKISSPKLLTQFSSIGRVIRRNSYFEANFNNKEEAKTSSGGEGSEEKKENSIQKLKNNDKNKETLASEAPLHRASSGFTPSKKEKVLTKSRFFEESPFTASPTFSQEVINCGQSILFCVCGKICAKSSLMCEDCQASCKVVEAAGYLYVNRDKSNLDRQWFQLVNTDLYCIYSTTICNTY